MNSQLFKALNNTLAMKQQSTQNLLYTPTHKQIMNIINKAMNIIKKL